MLTLFLIAIAGVQSTHSDIIGEAYSNSVDSRPSSAITYKLASVSAYTLSDETGWVMPKIVDDLSLMSTDGPVVNEAETVPSQTQYYDGSSNLSSSSLRCRLMVSMTSCYAANNCGWCKSLGRCIPGNTESPLYPCEPNMYIYAN